MIVYMPEESVRDSVKALGHADLEQQFLDIIEILGILTHGYPDDHPAIEMWRGYEDALFEYLLETKEELANRGIYKSSDWDNAFKIYNEFPIAGIEWPEWMDNHLLHKSHRQRLFLNDPDEYDKYSWDAIDPMILCHNECYVLWPTHIGI